MKKIICTTLIALNCTIFAQDCTIEEKIRNDIGRYQDQLWWHVEKCTNDDFEWYAKYWYLEGKIQVLKDIIKYIQL